jgi:hypothetical protein
MSFGKRKVAREERADFFEDEGVGGARRLMEREVSGGQFDDGRSRHRWSSFTHGPIDLRGRANWGSDWNLNTAEFRWGHIHIDVTAENPDTMTDLSLSVHAQVQIIGYVASAPFIMFSSSVANNVGRPESLSTGPARFVILEGEMPDSIELQMRARRGGAAETGTPDATETLLAMIQARFRK